MTIRARCPHCDGELAFQDAEEGTERECGRCHGGLRVPQLIRYSCPACNYMYKSGPQHIDRRFSCRSCDERITVPETSTALTPAHPGGGTDGDSGFFGLDRNPDDFERTMVSDPGDADPAESTSDDWFRNGEAATPQTGRAGPGIPDAAVPGAQVPTSHTVPPPADAGFLRRLAAGLIDTALIGFAQLVCGFLLGVATTILSGGEPDHQTVMRVAGLGDLVAALLAFAYYAGMEGSDRQATIGKGMLGLRVVNRNGLRIGYGLATLRTLAKLLSAVPCGLGFFLIGFTKRKQGLHDLIVGTYVERDT